MIKNLLRPLHSFRSESFSLHRRMQFIVEFKFNTSILVNHRDEIQNNEPITLYQYYSFFFFSFPQYYFYQNRQQVQCTLRIQFTNHSLSAKTITP